MSAKTTKEVCYKFFRNHKPSVLEIDGAWGSGKTHLWQTQLIKDAVSSNSYRGCAYASLFGIASLDELKAAVLVGYQPNYNGKQETKFQKYRRSLVQWAHSNNGIIHKIFRYIPEGVQRWAPKEVIKDLVSIGSHLAFSTRINSSLICLDDIERSDWKSINPEALLGFINWLKTDRNCSVVLIVNGLELGDGRQAYDKFHEKIIDVRTKFQPTPQELLPIVFDSAYPRRDRISYYVGILNISNIRLYARLRFLFDVFFTHFRSLPPFVENQIIASVVLLCWIIYGSSSPKIEISYLRSRKIYRSSAEPKETPEVAAIENLLKSYDFGAFDEIDECLVPFVRDGHLEGTNIDAVLNNAIEKFAKSNSQEAFFQAWRIFHDSFDDNENKFVEKLSGATISASRDGLSLNNLDSTVKVLRDLGRDTMADKLIEMYIQANSQNRNALDLSHPFAHDVTDKVLRVAIQRQAESLASAIAPLEAARIIVNRGERRGEARAVLASASVDDFVRILKADWGDSLHSLCSELLTPTSDATHSAIAAKTMEALTRIGATSKLNALRVARYFNRAEEK